MASLNRRGARQRLIGQRRALRPTRREDNISHLRERNNFVGFPVKHVAGLNPQGNARKSWCQNNLRKSWRQSHLIRHLVVGTNPDGQS